MFVQNIISYQSLVYNKYLQSTYNNFRDTKIFYVQHGWLPDKLEKPQSAMKDKISKIFCLYLMGYIYLIQMKVNTVLVY